MSRTTQALFATAAFVAAASGCGGSAGGATSPKAHAASSTTSVATRAPLSVVATYGAKALGIKGAQGVALGPDGNVYLTDASQRVVVVSPAGKVLRRWGGPGSAQGKFRFVAQDPTDPTHMQARITVGVDGTVYVSDSGNHRVEAFTSRGKYLRTYGRASGHGSARLLAPFDLVSDQHRNLYVADDQTETLSKMSPAGKLVWRVGGYTAGSPDLIGHMHVAAIDAHGRLVVGNDDGGVVVFVDENGHVLESFGDSDVLPDRVCDVTVDAGGNVWTIGCGVNTGAVFDRSHHALAHWSAVDGHDLEFAPRWAPDGRGYSLSGDGTLVVVRSTLR